MVAIKISDRIQTQITRTGGHADDTFVGDIKVSSFDLHIQKDTVGSETETAK